MLLPLLGVGRMWLLDVTLALVFLFVLSNGGIPSGATKSFLFYLQMMDLIYTEELWPGWAKEAARSLNWVNFRISDVACLGIPWLRPPVGEFAFFMALPVFLVGLAVAMLSCRWLVQRFLVDPVLDRCCCCAKRRTWRRGPPRGNYKPIGGDGSEEGLVEEEDDGGAEEGDDGTSDAAIEYEAVSPVDDSAAIGGSPQEDVVDDDDLVVIEDKGDDGGGQPHTLAGGANNNRGVSLHSLKYRAISTSLFVIYAVHLRLSELVLKKFEPCRDGGYMAQYRWIPCDLG